MQTNRPVPIENHAVATLTFIRASIESAGLFVVPGMAGIVMGIIGVLASVLASVPSLLGNWLEIWLVAAVLAFALGGALIARQATRSGQPRYFAPVKKFLLCLSPALMAGAVLTLTLWRVDMERLIPGVWLLLYGCAVLSASTVTSATITRLVSAMGCLFVLLGLIAFDLPPSGHALVLGIGFGALHVIFGILIGHSTSGD
ncbi:MAG TPA: hypothetical protein VGO53_11310 [Steroidobacteraceae bacterium]|jgi:hypothetical protein|nr:hypothetical protein [Steroidobacteraceae bacterium]